MGLKNTLAAPFASLLSGARAAKAEENERDRRPDESEEDHAKRMEELDEKERAEEEEREKEKARKAEDERKEKEARARGEGNDVDGDDADADDEVDADKKECRAVERTRCARIIAHGIRIGAVRQAGVLAFDTKLSSKAAIATLNASVADAPAPAPRRASLADRMSGSRVPNPGSGTAATLSLADQIVLAGKKRRGEI